MGIKVECVKWLDDKCVEWTELEDGKIVADVRKCSLDTQMKAQEFGTKLSHGGLRLEVGKQPEEQKITQVAIKETFKPQKPNKK